MLPPQPTNTTLYQCRSRFGVEVASLCSELLPRLNRPWPKFNGLWTGVTGAVSLSVLNIDQGLGADKRG